MKQYEAPSHTENPSCLKLEIQPNCLTFKPVIKVTGDRVYIPAGYQIERDCPNSLRPFLSTMASISYPSQTGNE